MYPQRLRLVTPIVIGLIGITSARAEEPESTRLEGSSIAIDDTPSAPTTGNLCWYYPKGTSTKDKKQLGTALAEAMQATKPAHVGYVLERIKSKAHALTLDCLAIIDVTKTRGYKRTKEIVFTLDKPGVDETLVERTLVINLGKVQSADLTPLWTQMWPKIAPPPPPPKPPEPPPVAETPFVDEELQAEIAAESKPEPEGPPRGPIVSAFVGLGLFSRSLDDTAPGRPVDQGGSLSLGVDATLHGAEIVRIAEHHDIDLDVSYIYRFVNAPDEADVGVNADRFNVGGAYRFQLPGPYLPRIGALVGYELLRNEIEGGDGAFSVRYGVLRVGLSISEPITFNEHLSLRAFLDTALRLTPGSDGADTSPSFDIGGGATLSYDRFSFRARARHARQSADAGTGSFTDRFLDIDFGLGFQL